MCFRASLRRALPLGLLLLVAPVCAQEALQAFFGPPAFRPQLSTSLHGYGFETVDVHDTDARLSLHAFGVDGAYKHSVSRTYEWLLTAGAIRYEIASGAPIPNSGGALIPDELWDLELNGGIKRTLANGDAMGMVLSAGSPSDAPFGSLDETELGATLFYLMPVRTRDAWAFFLNYSNQRSFLSHIPLPGAAYLWRPSRTTFAMLGVPVMMLRTAPAPDWSLQLLYMPPLHGHIRLGYAWSPMLESYLGLRSDRHAFLRVDRTDRDAWLRHEAIQSHLGLIWRLSDHLALDLSVGYAIDRKLYETDSFSDTDNALELDPGWLGSLHLRGTL